MSDQPLIISERRRSFRRIDELGAELADLAGRHAGIKFTVGRIAEILDDPSYDDAATLRKIRELVDVELPTIRKTGD